MSETWNFVREVDAAGALARARLDVRDLPDLLADILRGRGIARNVAISDSQLNQTFAYQIFSGSRHASRDKLIQLAFGLRLDPCEADVVLERGGVSALRPYVRRDVLVAWSLAHETGLVACDGLLWQCGELTICDGGGPRRRDDGVRRDSARS